jgi:hypothetical protein
MTLVILLGEGWVEGGEFNGITSQSEEKGLAYLSVLLMKCFIE